MLHRVLSLTVALCVAVCALILFPRPAGAADRDTYCVEVDVTNQITTVYRQSDRAIVRQMICSTGTGTKTPLGTYNLEKSRAADRTPWYYIGKFGCYVKYPTRIQGSILFHSLPYADKDMSTVDREALSQLGDKASHGCIRLRWQDAMWISENCPDGTTAKIYTGAARKEALRQLLLREGYAVECGFDYDQFMAARMADSDVESMGRGAVGDAVLALQQRLVGLGFLSGNPTGVYDDATVVAVLRYQSAAGATASGVADRALIDSIMSEGDLAAEYSTLTPGCTGTLVAKYQNALKALGLLEGNVDGVYGDELADAVALYCRYMGVAVTRDITPALRESAYRLLGELKDRYGVDRFSVALIDEADARTRQATPLYAEASTAADRLSAIPSGVSVALAERGDEWCRVEYKGMSGCIPTARLALTEGAQRAKWGPAAEALGQANMVQDSVGDGVLALQSRLRALGFYAGQPSPVYDEGTAEAVRAYQSACGLEATGEADVRLQRRIAESDDITGLRVELRPGDAGPAVAAMQRALIDLQYLEGSADGRFDAGTAEAVKRFTRANGLAEGEVATCEVQSAILGQYLDCEARYGSGCYVLTLSDDGRSARFRATEAPRESAFVYGSDPIELTPTADGASDAGDDILGPGDCEPVEDDDEPSEVMVLDADRPSWLRPRPQGL